MNHKRITKAAVILGVLGLLVLGMKGHAAKADAAPTPTATPTPMGGEYPYVEVEKPVHVETAEEKKQRELNDYIGLLGEGKVEGVAGAWIENGSTDVVHVGITDAADEKAIVKKLEKLGTKEVRLYKMKYTLRELRDIQDEIFNTYWKDESWLRSSNGQWTFNEMGVNVKGNVLCIGLYAKATEEDRKRIEQQLCAVYGDKVKFFVSDEVFKDFNLSKTGSETIRETSSFAELTELGLQPFKVYRFDKGVNGMYIVTAVILAVVIAVAAYALRRQAMQVRVTADGRQVTGGEPYSDAELERLARAAQGDVSEEGRNRIFAAYERERDKG